MDTPTGLSVDEIERLWAFARDLGASRVEVQGISVQFFPLRQTEAEQAPRVTDPWEEGEV
jgi:hypothetical protein